MRDDRHTDNGQLPTVRTKVVYPGDMVVIDGRVNAVPGDKMNDWLLYKCVELDIKKGHHIFPM